jgi:hypothetical protein
VVISPGQKLIGDRVWGTIHKQLNYLRSSTIELNTIFYSTDRNNILIIYSGI